MITSGKRAQGAIDTSLPNMRNILIRLYSCHTMYLSKIEVVT